jgi:hypothetical protein
VPVASGGRSRTMIACWEDVIARRAEVRVLKQGLDWSSP